MDAKYAAIYWAGRLDETSSRRNMAQHIRAMLPSGQVAFFVDPDGYTEKDKALLSAARLMAAEMGHTIGAFVRKHDSAVAPIR